MSEHTDPYKKQKRNAVLVATLILLVATAGALTFGIITGAKVIAKSGEEKENIAAKKAIAAVCATTDYKEKCIQRLEFHAGNVTDPKELIKVVFRLTIKQFKRAGNASLTLAKEEKDARANLTLQGCKELMDKAIPKLKRSYRHLSGDDVLTNKNVWGDLMTWLSATITYQETCLEGLFDGNIKSSAGEKMREALNTSMELTRSGVAMVNLVPQFMDLLKSNGLDKVLDHGNRRLLQYNSDKKYPSWLDDAGKNRRLLLRQVFDMDKLQPDFVVAKDGSGRFININDALLHVPRKQTKPTIIHIKQGVYDENVNILHDMIHLVFIGDGADKTRITGKLNYVDGNPIWKTATVGVSGDYFIAKNIGFENSATPDKHQAVALRVDADDAIFYNCTMDGYQGTLYVHANRQFYRDCTITGATDLAFGDASAVFQNSRFLIRQPAAKQNSTVTAQARSYVHQSTAIIVQNSTIAAAPGFIAAKDQHKTYLGRPGREYSRTIIMESFIDGLIDPVGWFAQDGDKGMNNCYFTEYNNRGPGADKKLRVQWPGIKNNISEEEAMNFTPGKIIQGDYWIKIVAVPYNSGFFTTATDQKPDEKKDESDEKEHQSDESNDHVSAETDDDLEDSDDGSD